MGGPRKSNLEERLRRAAFAIGDVSTAPGTTNRSSRVGSPSPISSDRRPMPPKVQEHRALSTPLPASPMALAMSEDGGKLEQPSNIALEATTTLEGTNSSNSSEIVVDRPSIPQTSSPVDEPLPADCKKPLKKVYRHRQSKLMEPQHSLKWLVLRRQPRFPPLKPTFRL